MRQGDAGLCLDWRSGHRTSPPSRPRLKSSHSLRGNLSPGAFRRGTSDSAHDMKYEVSPNLFTRQQQRHRRGRGRLIGKALAIDAEVLAHPLNVVPRFVVGNSLDPVDKISASGPWIAVCGDPLLHAAAASVISRECQGVRTAFVLQNLTEEG